MSDNNNKPTTTPSSSSTPPSSSSMQESSASSSSCFKEVLDAAGNTIRVGNLTFDDGILGRGSYSIVRAARRQKANTAHTTHTAHARKSRRDSLERSMSAPLRADFFHLTPEEKRRYGKKDTSSSRLYYHQQQRRRRQNLLARSKSVKASRSFDVDDDDDDSDSDDESLGDNGYGSCSSSDDDDDSNNNNHSTKRTELVAVKIFQKSILKRMRTMERDKETRRMQVKTALQNVEREIALMKKLSHPNLVRFYEAIDVPESDKIYMVIEYMPLGEILTYQNDGSFRRKEPKKGREPIDGLTAQGHFDEFHAALYFVDVLHGLAYLHQHHIVHRDLKPENILLDARGIAKLSDFGVSHMFDDNAENTSPNTAAAATTAPPAAAAERSSRGLTRTFTDTALEMEKMADAGLMTKTEGTWAFWSPEMCEGSLFSGYAADMWAAGVCLYIFVTGKLPFYSNVPLELMDSIKKAEVPYKDLELSENLQELLQMTLEKDPSKRAGVGDCMKHPFLLLARAQRIHQLSSELAKSIATDTNVEERDIRAAIRIVRSMPVVLLKSATKQLQEGFQAAKSRLSMGSVGKSSSFSERALSRLPTGGIVNNLHGSWSSDSKAVQSPRIPNRITEASQEFEKEEEGEEATSPHSQVTQNRDNKEFAVPSPPSSTPRSPFVRLFRPKPSSTESNTWETTSSSSSRLASIFRGGRRDSDASMSSVEGRRAKKVLFARKRSDVSSMSLEEEEPAGPWNRHKEPRTRVPNIVKRSLRALKRSASNSSDEMGR